MPRLTEASRLERRERIASAALVCFARDGIANTSMADVIAESGLSSGSIYSHFDSKADLLRFTVSTALEARFAGIVEEAGASSEMTTPASLLERLLGTSREDIVHAKTIVQIWGEVARSPELAAVASENVIRVRGSMQALLRPWAETRTPFIRRANALAEDATNAAMTVLFGWAVRLGLDPSVDPEQLRDSLVRSFADKYGTPRDQDEPARH